MTAITAKMVSELRQRSDAGMMDCKKALEATSGDMDAAMVWLQKKGITRAAQKAGRTAAEGLIGTKASADGRSAMLLELNCETDFVARNDQFQGLTAKITGFAFDGGFGDVEALKAGEIEAGKTAAVWLAEQAASVGENVQLRRIVRFDAAEGVVGSYIHAGSQIGVLVEVKATGDLGAAAEFARNVAMHIAASNPTYVSPSDIDAEFTTKQREIFLAQALESGKPQNIVEKMVDGRVAKWQAEISLVKQPYVKEPDITVEQYQKKVGGVTIARFARFQVGEGIEVQKTDLAAEVAAQLNR